MKILGVMAAVGLAIASSMAVAQAPAGKEINYDLPAQPLVKALNAFADRSNLRIVFNIGDAEGIQAQKLAGSYTPRAALEKLLANSGLKYEYLDSQTVAISGTPRKTSVSAVRMNLAQNDPPQTTQNPPEENGKSGEMEVTSTRLDGLNNKGIIDTGPEAAIYHNVIDREMIDRLGITSAEELFRFIPQTSSPTQTIQEAPNAVNSIGGLTDTPSKVSLRGFGSTQTLVLVNGRVLPRTSRTGGGGADISRIPIAAIDRVEILPASASAMYGAGAIGGAINIILRKNYQGQDLTAYAGTSYEGGAEEYRLTYLGGKTFNEGRTSLTVTADYQTRGQLTLGDRDFVDRARQRYPAGTTINIRHPITGAVGNAYEQLVVPTFAGSRAILMLASPTGDLGIPGAPGARFAMVPRGTTPEQSLLLTPSSFTATANEVSADRSKYDRISLYNPQDNYSIDAQIEHRISSRLTLYANLTARRTESDYNFVQPFSAAGGALSLSATDPLNPFRGPAGIGRAVMVYLNPVDLPAPRQIQDRRNERLTLGIKGALTPKWDWSVDVTGDSMQSTNESRASTSYFDYLQFETVPGLPGAAPAAQRRALYPLLADREAYPFTGNVADYFENTRLSESKVKNLDAIARLSGELLALPAGPWMASVRAQYTTVAFQSRQRNIIAEPTYDLLGLGFSTSDPPGGFFSEQKRATKAVGAETNIPVIGRDWRPIPIEGLDLTFGATREDSRSTGDWIASPTIQTDDRKLSTTVIGGLKLQLIRDVALRASHSEGTYPPDWDDVTGVETTQPGNTRGAQDSARGGTIQATNIVVAYVNGPSFNLRAETSKSANLGLILKPRFLPGLTVTVDQWETKKIDGIARVSIAQALGRPDAYGHLITRAAPTTDDLAKGWLGVVTGFDQRPQNLGIQKTQGMDIGIRYDIDAGDAGRFYLNTNASFTDSFKTQPVKNGPTVDSAGALGPVRRRGYSSLNWTRGALGLTLTANYVGKRYTATTAPSGSFPNASGIDGDHLPDYVLWDTQLTYETAASPTATGVMGLVSGIDWAVGVQNLFNKQPAFVTDGYAFYNMYQDPRLRYMYLRLKKSF